MIVTCHVMVLGCYLPVSDGVQCPYRRLEGRDEGSHRVRQEHPLRHPGHQEQVMAPKQYSKLLNNVVNYKAR